MSCQFDNYGNNKVYDNNYVLDHSLGANMLANIENSLQLYNKSIIKQSNVDITQGKICLNTTNWNHNNCLNVEAPCFIISVYKNYKFNIFAPVFAPNAHRSVHVKGLSYINNAGLYTVYGNVQNVNNVRFTSGEKCYKHINSVCGQVKGCTDGSEITNQTGVKDCTDGFETKNQTLVHNIFISGLDGDLSCGEDIFHNTSCPQQFEYKVENHQMLSGIGINQPLSGLYARVVVKDSVVSYIMSANKSTSSVLKYEAENGHTSTYGTDTSECLDMCSGITSSATFDEHYTIIQAFQQYDYDRCHWIDNDSENRTCYLDIVSHCSNHTNAVTGASILHHNPSSVHNTPSCTYYNNKSNSFKVLVNTSLYNTKSGANILQNGNFGEYVNINLKAIANQDDIACKLTQRIYYWPLGNWVRVLNTGVA